MNCKKKKRAQLLRNTITKCFKELLELTPKINDTDIAKAGGLKKQNFSQKKKRGTLYYRDIERAAKALGMISSELALKIGLENTEI